MRNRHVATVLLATLAAAAPCAAQGWSVADLGPESRFEYGCFGPCACPVLFMNVASGRMTMFSGDAIDPGNPYLEYDVTEVAWQVAREGGSFGVTGSGRYRRSLPGPEHQLTLDLAVGGGPFQRFDSGLVPRKGGDDTLDIDISIHGEFCFDSVFRVRATLRTTGVADGPAALSPRVWPNPFQSTADVAFAIPAPGLLDVRVYDAAGRQVATLAAGWRPAGPVFLRWDGRGADGRRAPAGVYVVRVAAGGRSATRRLALVP